MVTVMLKTRVAVLGLDGCSWRYLSKLLRDGALPRLKHLVGSSKCFRAYLRAFPPSTPPSWSSILTGVNPGKHGIFDFMHFIKSELRERLTNSLDLEHPRIYEMLAMLGIKSVMINPIPSYPLIKVPNTYVITHKFFTPKPSWYPESMGRFAKELISDESSEGSDFESVLEYAVSDVSRYLGVIEELLSRLEWSLFWINLNYPDSYLHRTDSESAFLRTNIYEMRLYGLIDKVIKLLLDHSDYLIIVSDHGFSHYRYVVNVNTYLHRAGFVSITGEGGLSEFWEHLGHGEKGVIRVSANNPLLKFILNTPGLRKLVNPVKAIYEKLVGRPVRLREYSVDVSNSRAFLLSAYSHGIVVKDEGITNDLINSLKRLEGIKAIYVANEVFKGPYLSRGCDLYVEPDYEGGYTLGSNKVKGVVIREKHNNNHHPNGILLLYGDGVRRYDELPTLPNYLVTNLVMYLLNQPLSHVADGTELLSKVVEDRSRGLKYENYLSKWRVIKRLNKVRL